MTNTQRQTIIAMLGKTSPAIVTKYSQEAGFKIDKIHATWLMEINVSDPARVVAKVNTVSIDSFGRMNECLAYLTSEAEYCGITIGIDFDNATERFEAIPEHYTK